MKETDRKTPEACSVLVTGGLGFIGTTLCRALLEQAPETSLTIVDNLSSTPVDYQSLIGRADIHITDLRDFAVPEGQRYEEIYHLASPVGSLGILEKHGYIASDIIELAQIASDLAAEHGARLLYVSSSEVYGRDGEHSETAAQVVPARHGSRMEYALGKLTAEHVIYNRADEGTHQVRIVRPFNVIGPWQSDILGFVSPLFFKAALEGQALKVHGDGTQTRSFCDVRDMASGLIAVQRQGRAGATYNVGNPDNRVTIRRLAELIVDVCDSESSIEHIDPVTVYGSHYLEAFNKMPVIERACRDTDWQPVFDLSSVLKRLHAFYTSEQSCSESRLLQSA